MSDFTSAFAVTVPAGTTQSNPLFTETNLGLCDVQEIDCVVPAGCAGNVGFQIFSGGSTSYPIQSGGWFVFDDYTYVQEVSNQIDSGQWGINAYNNDVFPHTLLFYFKANYVVFSPVVASSLPIGL